MSLMARWSGTCPECGETWQPGDFIRADEPEPGSLPTWQHTVCPDPLLAKHGVCQTCYLDHPKGECDR